MRIRLEKKDDIPAIHKLHSETFPTIAEADLVDRLREVAHPYLSLVAENGGEVIGHLFFSPVKLNELPQLKIMGLAPLAVQDQFQGNGIGSALVEAGLELCTAQKYDAVVVLGHASYYPRFGFKPAWEFGFHCKYPVPKEVFMARELVMGSLEGASGIANYHPAFDQTDD